MPIQFRYGVGKKTQFYLKKLVAAKSNEVISGGEKFYSDLAESLDKNKVHEIVKQHHDEFEFAIGKFITKKQKRLEKQIGIKLSATNPPQRLIDFEKAIKKLTGNINPEKIKQLENIYKHFAQQTRSEFFIG